MNTTQAAVLLGNLTPAWVRRQCAAGKLRASYYGRSWDIDPEAIAEYKAAHSNTPQPVATRHRRRRAA